MSQYKELIRQFDKIRSYVRDFYIYGFKTREDFREKSGRTYDNQRRRMESWFGDYIRFDQSGHKKSVFLTLDSGRMAVNPLYQAWKSKTFTDNDITLRFLLSDLLADGQPQSLEQIADGLQERYRCLWDTQTIRRKLSLWEKEGFITKEKQGKQYLYRKALPLARTRPSLFPALTMAVSFFQGIAPFGFVGSTILDFWNETNTYFRFRSDYLIHTLEDEILLPILGAIEGKQKILLTVKSTKTRRTDTLTVSPLKILTSTHTGRRYVCVRQERPCRLTSIRLDSVQNVQVLQTDEDWDTHMEDLQAALPYMWGVSFGGAGKQEPERVSMEIELDEIEEEFILTRLSREGRGGALKRLEPGVYEYSRLCLDSTELLPWVKSFTGRIRSFHCTNAAVEKRFWDDMEMTENYYLQTGEIANHEQN